MRRSGIRCPCARKTYLMRCRIRPGRSFYSRCRAPCSNQELSARASSSPPKDTPPPPQLTASRPDTPPLPCLPERHSMWQISSKRIKLRLRRMLKRHLRRTATSRMIEFYHAMMRKTPSSVALLFRARLANRKHNNYNEEEDYKLE